MDTTTALIVAKKSLDFLPSVLKTENAYLPLSSLPYSKEMIRSAIKIYIANCDISQEERKEVEMKYRLLANFLDDDKIQFVTMIDKSLNQVDLKSSDACKAWTQDPKNDANYKKYLDIFSEIDKERKNLNDELEYAYTECVGNSKKNVDPMPPPSDSAHTLPL